VGGKEERKEGAAFTISIFVSPSAKGSWGGKEKGTGEQEISVEACEEKEENRLSFRSGRKEGKEREENSRLPALSSRRAEFGERGKVLPLFFPHFDAH